MAEWRELPCWLEERPGVVSADWEVVKAALDNQHLSKWRGSWSRSWSNAGSRGALLWLREGHVEEEQCWYPGGHEGAARPLLSEWALQLRDLCLGAGGGGADCTPARLFYTFVSPRPPPVPAQGQRQGRGEPPADTVGRLVLVAVCFSGRGGSIARLAALTSSKNSFMRRG
jgi:hypothetical protein